MAVFRVNKTADYTVMSNYHLKDKQMSLKAKGLLSIILSLPNDWNYTVGGLVAICVESECAVKSALNELKKYGYLEIEKKRPSKENGGRYEYIYNIYEQPTEKQSIEIQGVENQPLEIQGVENNPLYKNTDISNTNKLNTDISNNIGGKPPRTRFKPPTLEDVQAYCKERQNNVDAERFIDYYTSNGWKVGKNTMKDWKAAVRNWERSTGKQEKPKEDNAEYKAYISEQMKKKGLVL